MSANEDLTMRDLTDELSYWRGMRARAEAQGQPGITFQRCIDSLEREIAEREASCDCGLHVPVASELLAPRDEHGEVEGEGW